MATLRTKTSAKTKKADFVIASKSRKFEDRGTEGSRGKVLVAIAAQGKRSELAETAPKKKKASLDKKDRESLSSYFGEHSGKIMELIEMNDSDGAMTLLKKKLLQTTVDILPYAEDVLRGSGTSRGTYQFVTLVSQIRELMADIQADTDRKFIARSISDNIIRPAFMDVAQTMITEHHSFKTHTAELLRPENTKKFNDMTKDLAQLLARKMNDVYRDVEVKIFEALKG